MASVYSQHVQTILSVACTVFQILKFIADSTLQFVPDMVVTPISFRCSRVVGSGKDFVAIWIHVGYVAGLSQ